MHVQHVGGAADERERRSVVARGERGDLGDARGPGVGDQLGGQCRADAVVLVRVGDRKGDLGARAVGPGKAGDRNRLRVALEMGDERVMGAIDGRELLSSASERQGFGPLKRARRDASPSCSKTARTVATSPSRSGRTRMVGPCLSLIARVCMGRLEKPTIEGWKSQPSVAHCADPD